MTNITLTFSQEDFDNYALAFEEEADWNGVPENPVLIFLSCIFELEVEDLEPFYALLSEQDKKGLWEAIFRAVRDNCSPDTLDAYELFTKY